MTTRAPEDAIAAMRAQARFCRERGQIGNANAWDERADAVEGLLQSSRSEGWRPIETAPKDATPVIAWNGHVRQWVRWLKSGIGNAQYVWISSESGREFDAKLWCPIPSPPTDQEEA